MDILVGFGYDSESIYVSKPDFEDIATDLKNMKNAFGTTNKLVFLNHLQAASIGQLVVDAGYKEIARFYSKSQGNDIVIYLSSTEKAKHPSINGGKASKTKQRGRKK